MFMASFETVTPVGSLDHLIHEFRGQRVMLDSDLARVYGVSTRQLNQAVQRNAFRFPIDFSFQLNNQEFAILKSQIVTSSAHGGRRKLPRVFTEHGAIMLASVLNSPVAVEASVQVVRAFVRMREYLSQHKQLAKKLAELEDRICGHDEALGEVFEAIRQLVGEEEKPHREIGFHVREKAPLYRVGVRRGR